MDACNRAHFYLWVSNRCVMFWCPAPRPTLGVIGRFFSISLRQAMRENSRKTPLSLDVWNTEVQRTREK